jgi:anti-sigma-K factor RskA
LAIAAVIVAAAVVAILASSGGKHAAQTPATTPLPVPSARVRLTSPTRGATTFGIADIVRRGNNAAVAIVGKGLPRNAKHNAYAVWLYKSASDAVRLGFVNPGVGKNGHLDTAGGLPPNAGHYSKLLITVETTANPTTPGPVVLEGKLGGG